VRSRDGLGVLAAVMFFALAGSVIVLAYHTLWRGSSRTLFSVQENRQLLNLGRSALAEGYYELQRSLDNRDARWFDWFTASRGASDRTFAPVRTRENAEVMSGGGQTLQYAASDVTLVRVKGLPLSQIGVGKLGVIDLRVVVTVKRLSPRHEATLTMIERRTFSFQDDFGPYGTGGRHIELSPTPAGTVIEE
jgi:hypothetical protein